MDELEKKRCPGPATDEDIAGLLLKVAKPVRDTAREAALLDRIVAAAERMPRAVAAPDLRPVAAQDIASRAAKTPPRFAALRRAPLLTRNESWGAVSLLAASLVIGFLAGQTTLTQTTMQQLADASGVSLTPATQDIARVLAAAEHEDDD